MDARVQKLRMRGVDKADAETLVKAGLDTPAKIKIATDTKLEALPGIGKAKVKKLRERFPKRKEP